MFFSTHATRHSTRPATESIRTTLFSSQLDRMMVEYKSEGQPGGMEPMRQSPPTGWGISLNNFSIYWIIINNYYYYLYYLYYYYYYYDNEITIYLIRWDHSGRFDNLRALWTSTVSWIDQSNTGPTSSRSADSEPLVELVIEVIQ